MSEPMKLPPYVTRSKTRHGKVVYHVRRNGRWVKIDAEPGAADFNARYLAALADAEGAPPQARAKGDSLYHLVHDYTASKPYARLAASTQYSRRKTLERVCARKHGDGGTIGDRPWRALQARHIVAWRDDLTPDAGNSMVKALRAMFKWAMKHKGAEHNPALGIEKLKTDSDGFHTLTPHEIEQYQRRHPLGTMARLTFDLALYTGARKADLANLGPKNETGGRLVYRQQKTGKRMSQRIPWPLRESLNAMTVVGRDTYLVSQYGRPFTVAGLGMRARAWFDQAGLPHCSLHGMRKALLTWLAHLGASEKILEVVGGHSGPQEAAKYTAAAKEELLSDAAMDLIENDLARRGVVPTMQGTTAGEKSGGKSDA